MRPRSVLLSLVLAGAAVVAAAPAAHAYPVCVVASTGGKDIPNVDLGQTCVGYPYGVWCDSHTVFSGDAYIWVDYCYPAPI